MLVAVGVDKDGYREILGVQEGTKEDTESWRDFLRHLKERGLKGVRLFISDKTLGLLESLPDFYADAQWQRCMVHWYRNVLKLVPRGKAKEVAAMLKAIHAQENRKEATKKATHVAEKLREMRLGNRRSTVEPLRNHPGNFQRIRMPKLFPPLRIRYT